MSCLRLDDIWSFCASPTKKINSYPSSRNESNDVLPFPYRILRYIFHRQFVCELRFELSGFRDPRHFQFRSMWILQIVNLLAIIENNLSLNIQMKALKIYI